MAKAGQRFLVELVKHLGGAAVAARRLGVSERLLARFLDGSTPVPESILLRMMDLAQETPGFVPPVGK